MTLIELMVGLAIVATALLMGIPSFALWMKNTRIRTAADVLQNSLQYARTEAVRRNQVVRFQMVDTLDGACALSASGKNWVTNLGSSATPASACGNPIDDTTAPRLLQKGPLITSASVQLTASQTAFAFNGLGRQVATTNPTTAPPSPMTVQITPVQGACLKSGGDVRCLNVVVSPAGQVRTCDPQMTTAGDSLAC